MAEKPTDDAMSFEQALERLERIVHQLESGEASLEQSIDLYTEGSNLKRHCELKLKDAQARIEKLQIDADGKPAGTVPFGDA
jgi:exodeoxyribonuclease VII small subunit